MAGGRSGGLVSGRVVKRKRRIAFVSSVSEVGGAERSMLQTIAALPPERYECHAIVPAFGSLEVRLNALGVPVHHASIVRMRRTFNPFRLVGMGMHLRTMAGVLARWCKENGIDLLHANGDQALLVAGPAARQARIPCIRHARDLRWPVGVGRWLGRQADHTIAVSQAVADAVIRRGTRNPVSVVYNGFDIPKWRAEASQRSYRAEAGIPREAWVVGMVAQPVFWKRHDLFLEAARRIGGERPDAHFVLAAGDRFGDGGLFLQRLRDQITQSGIGDRIHLLDWRDDIAVVMDAFDVLLHPAEGEPFGRVLVEAMALGKPVVAVRSGGPIEILRHGREGFLVSAGDVAGMVESVLLLARSEELRVRMAESCRRRAEEAFGVATHRAGVEEVYDRLLSGHRGVAMLVGAFPVLSETFIRRAMVALIESGTDLHCFALSSGTARMTDRERRALAGRLIFRPRIRLGGIVRGLWRLGEAGRAPGVRRIWDEIRKGDPDKGSPFRALVRLAEAADWLAEARRRRIVHIHAHFLSAPADVGRLMAVMASLPFSVSAHGRDVFCASRRAAIRRVLPAAWMAVCSRAGLAHVRRLLPEYPTDQIRLIPHGLLDEEFSDDWDHPRPPRIAAAGRLIEKKGFAYLVEACRILRHRGLSFECVIAGEGPLRPLLTRRIAEAGLKDHVHLAGVFAEVRQVMALFLQSRVVAIPSVPTADGDQDGIPNVAREAMAAGVPVVAFATGGLPEVVADGRTGFLVSTCQSEKLADALGFLLEDEAKARAMGRAARAEAERYFDVKKEAALLREGFFGRGRSL